MKPILLILFYSIGLRSYSQWQNLDVGTSDYVRCLTFDSTNNILYAGGNFIYAGAKKVDQIARWNGFEWDSLAGGGLGNPCYALAIYHGTIYASTMFSVISPNILNCLATWNGSTWEWDTLNYRVNSNPLVFKEESNELYLGGAFTNIGTLNANRIAKYDGTSFSTFLFPVGAGTVNAIEFYQGQMYVGGNFYDSITGTNDLERWNGTAFEPFGSGGLGFGVEMIKTMAVYNNELYIGGYFNIVDGNPANYIMRWDGFQFRDVGGGMDGMVHKLRVYNGELYASGIFQNAGSVAVDYIAKWNGTSWNEVGPFTISNTLNNCVIYDFCFGNNDLYIAGYFDYVDSIRVNNIAKYSGINQSVMVGNIYPFHIYPTPASGILTIELTRTKIESVRITDYFGKLIKNISCNNPKLEIDISTLVSGIYFVEVGSDDRTFRKRFVKE